MTDALRQALLLSAAGIAMAIPTYLFYMYLASRARKIVNNIERAGLECVHIICDARMASRPAAAEELLSAVEEVVSCAAGQAEAEGRA